MILATYGALAAGHLAIAALFLRLWGRHRAAMLMVLAVSFALMALTYILLCFVETGDLPRMTAYLARLLAFIAIIAGLVVTNIGNRPR